MNSLKQTVNNKVQELLVQKKALNKKYSIFVIGNTRVEGDKLYYWTPFRKSKEFILLGIVLFSETEAKIVLEIIDGLVDYIYVDCEKKSKNTNLSGLFNFERLSYETVSNSYLRFYKGNDITTRAIDGMVNSFFLNKKRLMGGSNILIAGMGNLGFKISLKFVERGAHIYVLNRTKEKAIKLIEAINIIKPEETISDAKYLDVNLLEKSVLVGLDVVILCYSERYEGIENLFNSLTPKSIVIDVGKGCLSNDDLESLVAKKINCFRLDIGDALINFIENDIQIHKYPYQGGEKQLHGKRIISRGNIGLKNDIIVDNIDNPTYVYGVCDGRGGFVSKLDKEIIKFIDKFLLNKSSV
jgi:hypothetical protein